MADPLKNPGRWSAYCYTFATGKRPNLYRGGEFSEDTLTWFSAENTPDEKDPAFLPLCVFDRLVNGRKDEECWVDYPSYLEAIAAANDAARLAIADGAWKPEAA